MINAICLVLLLVVGVGVNAAEYRIAASGPFITITDKSEVMESKAISIRKTAVLSAQLDKKRVTIVSSTVEVTLENKDLGTTENYRPVGYVFDNNSETEAKKFYETIMQHLGS